MIVLDSSVVVRAFAALVQSYILEIETARKLSESVEHMLNKAPNEK